MRNIWTGLSCPLLYYQVSTHHRCIGLPVPTLPDESALYLSTPAHTSLIAQFCSTLAQWQQPLFRPIQQLQPTKQLLSISQVNGTITVVSDASVQKDKNCGFAWVIAHNEQTLWRGVGLAPGHEDDIYLGRVEAFGLFASLTFLQHYIQSYGRYLFSASPLQCFCNNLGLITTITDMMTPMII